MGRSNRPGEKRTPQRNHNEKQIPKWRVNREEIAEALEEADIGDRIDEPTD